MDHRYSETLNRLIHCFSTLPGIGRKTAQRLAIHILKQENDYAKKFASTILEVKAKTKFCSQCHTITEDELCFICRDPKRDIGIICVVSEFQDIFAIESTHEYQGLYHVIGGVLSPLDNVGPDELNIKSLLRRIEENETKELILAMTANTEGEATISYLAYLLKPFPINISRIARGVPVGSQLEFIDQVTLSRALSGRSKIE
jgi:recombination protein RecR